jgi:excisionase family DNA binding protein
MKAIAEKVTIEKIWLSETEAASYTSLSRSTINKERFAGKITYREYGRKIIYNRADLDKFIERNTELIKSTEDHLKSVKHKNRIP